MNGLLQDVRHSLRTLRLSPTFTLLTVLTLSLAIGVNTAIFSMVNVLLLRPLPIAEPDEVGFIYSAIPQQGIERSYVSAADFLEFRRELKSFDELAAVLRGRSLALAGTDEPLRVTAFECTANFFEIWGVEPHLGRTFGADEDEPGAERLAVLAHGFWKRRFGGDAGVIGRTVELDGLDTTIVGVISPELEFGSLAVADIWVPLRLEPASARREDQVLWTSGRLREQVTLEQADQEVEAMGRRLAETHPETNAGVRYRVLSVNQVLASKEAWTIFYLLILTVAFVLLIACSNVATMMLARATARTKELAIRTALGAGRLRIVRQQMTESLMLSLGAGVLALPVARASLAGLVWMAGDNPGTNFFQLLEIDRNVLLFTAAVALLAPFFFGFLPALRASRPALAVTLKDSGPGSGSGAALRGRRLLVTIQVALALSLMVMAGLLIRTMVDARTRDWGFETEGIITARIDLPAAKYDDEDEWQAFFEEVLQRVRTLPGVEAAAWASARPILGGMPNRDFLIEGEPVPPPERTPWTNRLVISPAYPEVIGLPLVRGRVLTPTDREGALPVVLINKEMVRRYWPEGDPLGQRVGLTGDGGEQSDAGAGPTEGRSDRSPRWLTIVGIVADIHAGDPEEPAEPILFLPLGQNPEPGMALLVRSAGDLAALGSAMRQEFWAVDSDQPVADVRTLEQILADELAVGETLISIFVAFAVFALVMAAMGIYGVVSFSVAQRTREIGVRMALGAGGRDVLRMVARQALRIVVTGVAAGSLAAVVLSRVLASAVPGVSPGDPLALAGVALVLSLVALVATWVPARRAVRVDPVIALRQE